MTKKPLSKDEKRQERMRKKLYERTKKEIAQGKYFESKREENVIHWCTFFRRNIHRFATNYLGIKLHLFQMIAMYLMNISPTVVLLCARAFSKSFITALWACCVCLLYPNSKIVATALTKKQASLLVKEKIQKELMKMSPRLASHIKEIKTSQNDIEVIFENGTSFICCVCGEQSRGIRSTVLLVDEFRLVDKEVWDYTSHAADMIYDDVEQCYTTTIVTTVEEGKKHFRFVGNHDPKINWYEDSKDVASMKAKTPLTDPAAEGHTADANDPNKVNYTQGNEKPEEDWNIIWNRPAGSRTES